MRTEISRIAAEGAQRRSGDTVISLKQTVDLRLEAVMKSIAEADWKLEHPFVCRKDQDISCGIENGRAYLAMLKVLLHQSPHIRREGIV
jgi:hypothetical protein